MSWTLLYDSQDFYCLASMGDSGKAYMHEFAIKLTSQVCCLAAFSLDRKSHEFNSVRFHVNCSACEI